MHSPQLSKNRMYLWCSAPPGPIMSDSSLRLMSSSFSKSVCGNTQDQSLLDDASTYGYSSKLVDYHENYRRNYLPNTEHAGSICSRTTNLSSSTSHTGKLYSPNLFSEFLASQSTSDTLPNLQRPSVDMSSDLIKPLQDEKSGFSQQIHTEAAIDLSAQTKSSFFTQNLLNNAFNFVKNVITSSCANNPTDTRMIQKIGRSFEGNNSDILKDRSNSSIKQTHNCTYMSAIQQHLAPELFSACAYFGSQPSFKTPDVSKHSRPHYIRALSQSKINLPSQQTYVPRFSMMVPTYEASKTHPTNLDHARHCLTPLGYQQAKPHSSTQQNISASALIGIRVVIPGPKAGSVIGKQGAIITSLRKRSLCKIIISDSEYKKNTCAHRVLTIIGQYHRVSSVLREIWMNILTEENIPNQSARITLIVPSSLCGKIIGVKGTQIRSMRQNFGIQCCISETENSADRHVTLIGNPDQVANCVDMICSLFAQAATKNKAYSQVLPSHRIILPESGPNYFYPALNSDAPVEEYTSRQRSRKNCVVVPRLF